MQFVHNMITVHLPMVVLDNIQIVIFMDCLMENGHNSVSLLQIKIIHAFLVRPKTII